MPPDGISVGMVAAVPHGVEIYKEILDRLPSAILTVTPEFEVVWVNRTGRELIPQAVTGAQLYSVLAEATNEEKLDRLLLRGEKVMFSAGPGLPLLEWLVNGGSLDDGNLILMAWDPMITDEMVQRRATFSMAAAHELRSPLTALIGFAEIFDMERDNLNPAQTEAVSIIRENALYLQTLVNDILDLTSNSFGELTLTLSEVALAEPLRNAVASLREIAETRGQSVTLEIEPELPTIESDARRIRQVIENLLQNASVHNPPATSIRVSAGVRDAGVVIAVEDDGRGIPFDPPELAFGSFRHGGTIDFSQVTGSGIGLTVCKRLVELHRGRISVESSSDGSRFEIWLPLDRSTAMTRSDPGPA
jgi:signal transduction histidine kinase